MEYNKQSYAKKLDSLVKMAKVVGRHKLLKITQKIDNLSKFIISKQIELIITKFPTNKSPRSDYFTGDFYQML